MVDVDLEATDQELIEFFSAFDDVVATVELKEATLAAIFSEMDGEAGEDEGTTPAVPVLSLVDEGMPANDAVSGVSDTGASLRLVDATDADDGANMADTADVAATPSTTAKGLTVVNGGVASHATSAHVARRRPLRMRIAAAIVIVALVGTVGGVAYAVPVSRVQVTEGGTTVDLGVNMFGMTVAADATTDEGRAILAEADVRDRGFEDALTLVLDKMTARGEGDGSVNVQVNSTFGGGGLDRGAERVIASRGLERGEGARGTISSEGAAPAQDDAASGVGNVSPNDGGAPSTGNGASAPTGGARGMTGDPMADGQGADAQGTDANVGIPSDTGGTSSSVGGAGGTGAMQPQGQNDNYEDGKGTGVPGDSGSTFGLVAHGETTNRDTGANGGFGGDATNGGGTGRRMGIGAQSDASAQSDVSAHAGRRGDASSS